MPEISRSTATAISLPSLPIFTAANAYPLSRLVNELKFAIAQRNLELEEANSPQPRDWINDAYRQVLGMVPPNRQTYSGTFSLPALTSTVALPAMIEDVYNLNRLVDGTITPVHKSVDIEYWRSLEITDEIDMPLLNYYMFRDNEGVLLQFHQQSVPVSFVIDGVVKPPALIADTDCPALPEPLALGVLEMAISIAMRRLGDYTHAGVQQNAALGIIRSHLDEKAESRKGTIAAITRPRTLEAARRAYGT